MALQYGEDAVCYVGRRRPWYWYDWRDGGRSCVEAGPIQHYPTTRRQPTWQTTPYYSRQTYSRPIRAPTDNPATRDMHTGASEKRKDFLAARALLKAELAKVMGDDIVETMAADQADITIAGMSCVGCMEWLERRYGT